MQKRTLSLIHLESAGPLMATIDQPGVTSRLVAMYLSTPKELRALRVNGGANTPEFETRLDEADEVSIEDVTEMVTDFFGQHQTYQNALLKSSGIPLEMIEAKKMELMEKAMGKKPE